MRVVHYEAKDTASTENHQSVDAQIAEVIDHPGVRQDRALREGFAASSGIRPESAETGGQWDHPETLDEAMPDLEPLPSETENAGLADN